MVNSMASKNIGALGRTIIRKAIGTDKGNTVIDAIEKGYLPALDALIKGKFGDFWELLPANAQEELFKLALSQFGTKGN